MKLFAIRHKESGGYVQFDSEVGNFIVGDDDAFFTSGDKSHCENWLEESIYIEDEGELDASEFEIVEFELVEKSCIDV